MKNIYPRYTAITSLKISRHKLYIAIFTVMAAGQTMAAPEGGLVVGGAGTIDQAGLDTTIRQASDRMAIDWQSFDVKSNERVQFIQPKSTSVALNRVLSNKGSEILGRIDANGQVFLINPNGVVFGRDSQINVGGILASGLSIDPNKFMNGEFTLNALEGTEGKVINSGIINAATGGSVTLVGQQVKNEGLISANLGAVSLAAGKEAVVTFDRGGMLGVKVTKAVLQDELGVDAAVINSGEINAQGGQILLTASVSQDIFSDAVNHGGMSKETSVVVHGDGSFTLGEGSDVVNTGSINASAEVGDGGEVVVLGNNITSTGKVQADAVAGVAGNIELHSTDTTFLKGSAKVTATTSAKGLGGDVKILGNKVGLLDASEVNASGANGGGQILIGGDKTGNNNKIRNANFIYLGENSRVKADGLLSGDGGKLITFASNTARIYGSLSTRGGNESGNGGFIETSGLKYFELKNTPDIGSAVGHGGTWLIDPYDIEILENAIDDSNDGSLFESTKDNAELATSALNTALINVALTNDTKVIVRTGSGGGQLGNITLSDDLRYNFSGTATLQLEAHNDIKINSNIERSPSNNAKGTLNVTLIANSDNSGGGSITLASGKTIATQGGNFTVSGVNFTSTDGTINTSNEDILANTILAGDIKIAATGDVNVGAMDFHHNYDDNQTPTIKNLGSIDISGENVTFHKILNFNNTGQRKGNDSLKPLDFFDSTNNQNTFLQVNAENDIRIATGATIYDQYGDQRDALDINLTAGNAIEINADIYTSGGNFQASAKSFTSTGFVINTDHAHNGVLASTKKEADWSNGGNVELSAESNLALGSVITDGTCLAPLSSTCTGNLTITGTGQGFAFTQAGKLVIAGDTTINAGNAPLVLDDSENDFKNLAIGSAKSVSILDTNTINLGAITLVGDSTTSSEIKADSITQQPDTTLGNHNGGEIKLTASTSISDARIDTSGVSSPNAVGGNGGNGGKVTLAAPKISLSAINSSGGNATANNMLSYAGGTAGIISVTAEDITVNGDLIASGGAGINGGATPVQASVTLALNNTAGSGAIRFADALTSEITVNGNTANDSLTGFASGATWRLKGINSGTIGTITFNNIEKLIGGDGDDKFIIEASGSADSIDGGGGDGKNQLTGRHALNTWNITSENTGNLAITSNASSENLGNPGITPQPEFYVTSFSRIQILNGGSQNDIFNIQAAIDQLIGNEGDDEFRFNNENNAGTANSINGGAGTNTLTGRHAPTTWAVTENYTGNVGLTDGAGYVTEFSEIQILRGGSKEDTFTINATIDSVFGGDGDDSFLFSGTNNTGSASIVDGEKGSNTLIGRDAPNTWNIRGKYLGKLAVTDGVYYVADFKGIQILQGGDKADSFVFSNDAEVDSAKGGNGTNTVNLSEITNLTDAKPLVITLGSAAIWGVTEVSKIIGNGSDFLTLAVASGTNHWSIFDIDGDAIESDGINDGRVTSSGNDAAFAGTIEFVNIKNLQGGLGRDTFDFSKDNSGSITGTISGGGNKDTLIGRKIASTWNITAAKEGNLLVTAGATYVNRFSDIQILQGDASVNNKLVSLNSANEWTLDENGIGSLKNDSESNQLTFTGFAQLVGGAFQDNFTIKDLPSQAVTLDGGSTEGTDTVKDMLDLRQLQAEKSLTVGVGAGANTAINLVNIETLKASSKNNNTLVADAAAENTWNITDENAGDVKVGSANPLGFSGFANLTGGAQKDRFNFSNSSARISGVIDGGGGDDSLNLLTVGRDLNVHIVNADKSVLANNINILDIEHVDASADYSNSFTASDSKNTWSIDGVDSGIINHTELLAGTRFSNFQNLIGGAGDDSFAFLAGGKLTGYVDGAGQVTADDIDFSQLPSVNLILGDSDRGYRHIELYKGNNTDSALTGTNDNNIWTLTQNEGAITGIGNINNTVFFSGFTTLAGGSGNDEFFINQGTLKGSLNAGKGNDIIHISGGSVLGTIKGNEGDDTLDVTIADSSSAKTTFAGGSGVGEKNSISVSGGGSAYTAAHTLTTAAAGQLVYTNPNATNENNNIFTLIYSDIGSINDMLSAESLTLNNTLNADIFAFSNNAYRLNNSTSISFSHKNNLVIAADTDDKVSIEQALEIPKTLTIQNASVTSTTDGLIIADSLNFLDTLSVGSAGNRLRMDVANLSASAAAGDIYLQAERDISLAGLSSSKRLDLLSLEGNVGSSTALTSTGDITINASAGDINLENANRLAGNLNLVSSGNIRLKNLSATRLGEVQAVGLAIDSTGAIQGSGAIRVSDLASFVSSGDINLMHADNNFTYLTLGSADNFNQGNASITDKNSLVLLDSYTRGAVDIHSFGIMLAGAMDVAELTVDAGQGAAQLGSELNKTIAASKAINITASGITQTAKLQAGGDITLHATSNFNQQADLESGAAVRITADSGVTTADGIASKGVDVSYKANDVMSLVGDIVATNSLAIAGNKAINQSGNFTSAGDTYVETASSITMSDTANTTATNGNVFYSGSDVAVGLLQAPKGRVVIKASNGAVMDNNGDHNNINAARLEVDAATGIGSHEDAFDSKVRELAVSNLRGTISIINNEAVTLSQLRNNGNTYFTNTSGSVALDNTNGTLFNADPLAADGGTVNNYYTDYLSISVNDGDLIALGPSNTQNADIIAGEARLFVPRGTAGNRPRPLGVKVPGPLFISGKGSWRPKFFIKPGKYENNATIQADAADIIASQHEQLVEVETLEEINPAVFTAVRNYMYDEIAILLPEDQGFYDEDYESTEKNSE
ncbi:MAG TPA: filamentous hemagglutinin N-terminal domain-containing protein [Cellvibrio sp.]|nr:filamentous hemagglutinin N-terminal domain-containing protein [Cellvibrio sp.]